jgi:hypothetical protein
MKFWEKTSLTIFLGLLILASFSGFAEIGLSGSSKSLSGESSFALGSTAQGGQEAAADGLKAGDLKAAEPLFPRGLRINPPTPENPSSLSSPPGPANPPIRQPEKGAINPRTGESYPPVPGGVLNPKSGEVMPKVDGGYINPKTGEFIPAGK